MVGQDEDMPSILYKYRDMKINYHRRIISHGEIYFSKYFDLNDPCERFFRFSNGKSEKEFRQYMQSSPRGVFSLCETRDSLHMYAYYANGFRGVCIGFNTEIFNESRKVKLNTLGYELALMSSLPIDNNGEFDTNQAEGGKIYLSDSGKYCVRSPGGRIEQGMIDKNLISNIELKSKLNDQQFLHNILEVTLNNGHTLTGYPELSVQKMCYVDEPPNIIFENRDWEAIYTSKYKIFSEEKEWRLIDNICNGTLNTNCQFVKFENESGLTNLPDKFKYGFVYCEDDQHHTSLEICLRFYDTKGATPKHCYLYSTYIEKFNKIIGNKSNNKCYKLSNKELLFLNSITISIDNNDLVPVISRPFQLCAKEVKQNIREIIFGYKISEKDVDWVMKKLRNNHKVNYFVAMPKRGEYKVEIIEFEKYEKSIKDHQLV